MLWARVAAIGILLAVALIKPRVEGWLENRSGDSVSTEFSDSGTISDSTENSSESHTSDALNLNELIAASGIETDPVGDRRSDPPARPATGTQNPKSGKKPPGSSNQAAGEVRKSNPDRNVAPSGRVKQNEKTRPGKLTLVDKQRQKFRSTAGLMYVQGSADGHRLKHVLKHARDIPDKRIHGVFDGDGDRDRILAWIDIAYEAARKGGKGTKTQNQGGRVVHTVRMSQRIGYVGGQIGKQKKYPQCRYLRLVIQNGNEVVTAYPADSL